MELVTDVSGSWDDRWAVLGMGEQIIEERERVGSV
jgi:hypothetical protein